MTSIESRKSEHVEIALRLRERPGLASGWDEVELVHEAMPEVDLDQVDLRVELLGASFAAPLMIAGMTGGHQGAAKINATLARVAAEYNLPMGLGSQRAALLDPSLEQGYRIARESAPGAFLIGNIGASQLIDQDTGKRFGLAEIERAVEMIEADALAIHLNPLEELIQPEGDRRTRGIAEAIGELAETLAVPVVVKETGAGISPASAARVAALPVAALDVGGAGGTNFAAIERERAAEQESRGSIELGDALADWGIPTAISVLAASGAGKPVIATGGVRSGMHAAKALTLGAAMTGVARPLLAASLEGEQAVGAWVDRFLGELRAVMLLCGCERVSDLHRRPPVLRGRVLDWAESLAIKPSRPAHGR